MLLHILRHGETDFNRQGILQGSSVDTDLNAVGLAQARAFYEHYQDIDFQLIVTSALKRSHQTVQHFIDKPLPWVKTPDINEIRWGHHEGQVVNAHWNAHWHEVKEAWNSGDLSARMPGGESAAELNHRLERFIAWVKTQPAERVLVCTHGRTLRGLVSLLKGTSLADMEGVQHANTGCYMVEYQGNDKFKFLLENDTSHLLTMPSFAKGSGG